MSVLIKGISFPRKPDQITVIFRFNDSTGDVTHTHYMTSDEIVEVPTPHGRLIDIETLKDDMAVLLERNGKLIDEWLAYRVEDTIDDQATIIEAEEGEGE